MKTDDKVIEATSGQIATPVRYDADSRHIFDANGHSISWFPRNTHDPRYHLMTEDGEYFAECINQHEALTNELKELRAENAKMLGFAESLNSIAFEEWHGPYQDDGCWIFGHDGKVASGKNAYEAYAALKDTEADDTK